MIGPLGIFDLVVIGIAVIFLIIGVVRGMRKIFFGLIASLIAITLAALLTGVAVDAVVTNTTWDDSLVTVMAQPIASKLPFGNATLVYEDIDGDPGTPDVLGFYDGETWHPFADVLGESTLFQKASGVIESQVQKLYPDDTAQLSFVLIISKWLTAMAFSAVLFIVLWIAFAVVFALLNKLVKKFVTGTYIGHFLNKVLGGVLGLVFAWVIIMAVLTVLQILSPFGFVSTVNDMVNNSLLGPYLVQYNFLYRFVGSAIDLSAIAAKVGGGAL